MEENKEKLEVREKPVADNKVESLKVKVKKKPKQLGKSKKDTPKINLNANKETTDAVIKPTENISIDEQEVKEAPVQDLSETPTIEEITDEVATPATASPSIPVIEPSDPLPEGVDKLVDFMKDTGGNLQDYVRLNADYTTVDDVTLLKEYYKNTKPHLDSEEVEFILDDKFSYDEEYDEAKDIRKKKLAIKEEVVKAKGFLEDLKSKYYEEIKLRPGATQEQIKATNFFNRYNEEQKSAKQQHEAFMTDTKNHFSQDFKGFEFNLGERTFNYNVNNKDEIAKDQSDIQDFVKTFLNKDGTVNDYSGYHKAIYSARNSDAIANHFYEQGKADAIKNVVSSTKNIDNSARFSKPADHVYLNGLRIKSVTGVDGSKLKIKTRNKT